MAGEGFGQARERFDAAWNHQMGDHPINDSAQVQRATKALGAQYEQLPMGHKAMGALHTDGYDPRRPSTTGR
ncbi:MAG: hypothetical protein EPN51_04930 [Mycobacterium sp.]|nr:MAG: hypothetical protein EPN51_04930 [Mycobacterium sp.]